MSRYTGTIRSVAFSHDSRFLAGNVMEEVVGAVMGGGDGDGLARGSEQLDCLIMVVWQRLSLMKARWTSQMRRQWIVSPCSTPPQVSIQ